MRIYRWRQHSKTCEWLRNYEKTRQLQSIHEELFWNKNKCMEDYAQPTIRTNPDYKIIHVGTNNLSSKKESTETSSAIVDLVLKPKSDTCQVSVSNLTTRSDQYRKKALEVKQHMKVLCREKNINVIDYGNTITVRHLNGSKLHLNLKENKVLTEKFTEAVSNILY